MVTDLAWAAGVFEGEGSIVVRPERGSIQLTLYSTDLDIIERFAEVVGVGSIKGPRIRGHYKPMWEWHAYSSNARLVLCLLAPWFGARRTERTLQALTMPRKNNSRSRYVRKRLDD